MKSLLSLEWDYLTPEAKFLAQDIMVKQGIKDLELAMEMAILILGDEKAFSLPRGDNNVG